MGRMAVDREREDSLVKLMITWRKEIIHFECFLMTTPYTEAVISICSAVIALLGLESFLNGTLHSIVMGGRIWLKRRF